MKKIDIYFDGACHNKAGLKMPMGVGVAVLVNGTFNSDLSCATYVGVGTSNIAEWRGCLLALCTMLDLMKGGEFPGYMYTIYSDSQLITNQFNGDWAVNKEHLLEYYKAAKEVARIAGFTGRIVWVRRHRNTQADILSKEGLAQAPKVK